MNNLFKDFKEKCIDFQNYKKYNSVITLEYKDLLGEVKSNTTETVVELKTIKNCNLIPLKTNNKVLVLNFVIDRKKSKQYYIFSTELEDVYMIENLEKYI